MFAYTWKHVTYGSELWLKDREHQWTRYGYAPDYIPAHERQYVEAVLAECASLPDAVAALGEMRFLGREPEAW